MIAVWLQRALRPVSAIAGTVEIYTAAIDDATRASIGPTDVDGVGHGK